MLSKRLLLVAVAILALSVITGGSAVAEGPTTSFGVRAGYSVKPDQIVIGAQSVLGHIVDRFRFAPSIDLGFGDNLTTVTVNGDVRLLSVSPPRSPAGFYAAAGPTLTIINFENAGSDTEVGVSLVGGLTLPMGNANAYNLEARVGIGDVPDFRILFGVFFGGHKRTAGTSAAGR